MFDWVLNAPLHVDSFLASNLENRSHTNQYFTNLSHLGKSNACKFSISHMTLMSSLCWYYRETFLHVSGDDSKLAFNYLSWKIK